MTSEHGHAGIELSGMPERGLKTSWTWPRIETLGRSAYERSFGINFLEEGEIDAAAVYGLLSRVIPASTRYGLPDRLRGRSVAIVGNSVITGVGAEIDSHDEVIRMTTMRNWARVAEHDGERVTLWAGMLARVLKGSQPIPPFERLVGDRVPLWCLSPFHITCDAYNYLRACGALEELLVLPPAACLFDDFHKCMGAEQVAMLYGMPPGTLDLSGFNWYERILTGTRLALLMELCGVSHVSLYGFDLFSSESGRLWSGHDVSVDRQLLAGLGRRLAQSGRGFRWHGHAEREA